MRQVIWARATPKSTKLSSSASISTVKAFCSFLTLIRFLPSSGISTRLRKRKVPKWFSTFWSLLIQSRSLMRWAMLHYLLRSSNSSSVTIYAKRSPISATCISPIITSCAIWFTSRLRIRTRWNSYRKTYNSRWLTTYSITTWPSKRPIFRMHLPMGLKWNRQRSSWCKSGILRSKSSFLRGKSIVGQPNPR